MKVTKAQVQANRARIVETASRLFRERGYDGVGVADLMAAAGLTHGGFYKHFSSKADLMAESAACSIAQALDKLEGVDDAARVAYYLSREHRDAPGDGCTMAALCADAARQSDAVKAAFAEGLERRLSRGAAEDQAPDPATAARNRAQRIDRIAHLIGAQVLSRACPDDSPLADEILQACREALLAQTTQ